MNNAATNPGRPLGKRRADIDYKALVVLYRQGNWRLRALRTALEAEGLKVSKSSVAHWLCGARRPHPEAAALMKRVLAKPYR